MLIREQQVSFLIVIADRTSWGWEGYVLATKGEMAATEITDLGRHIEDLDLPDVPGLGMWVWEGILMAEGAIDVAYTDGNFRRPTDEELRLLSLGQLWPTDH